MTTTDNLSRKADYIVKEKILPNFKGRIVSASMIFTEKDNYPVEVESSENEIFSFNFKKKNMAKAVLDSLAITLTSGEYNADNFKNISVSSRRG